MSRVSSHNLTDPQSAPLTCLLHPILWCIYNPWRGGSINMLGSLGIAVINWLTVSLPMCWEY